MKNLLLNSTNVMPVKDFLDKYVVLNDIQQPSFGYSNLQTLALIISVMSMFIGLIFGLVQLMNGSFIILSFVIGLIGTYIAFKSSRMFANNLHELIQNNKNEYFNGIEFSSVDLHKAIHIAGRCCNEDEKYPFVYGWLYDLQRKRDNLQEYKEECIQTYKNKRK